MSSEKFTPGEWQKCKIKHFHPHLIGETVCVKIGENLLYIDYIDFEHQNQCFSESEANAALIAAAPEMYDLLRRMVEYADNVQLIPLYIQEAEKLLKKARGEK